MHNTQVKLSTLWLFATLNYLYCDVVTLMDGPKLRQVLAGRVEGMDISAGFLFAAAALVEIPIAMVLVSRLARPAVNRWLNLAAATVMTLVQAATLFAGTPSAYYVFFSALEIGATVAVVAVAWRWRPHVPEADSAVLPGSGAPGRIGR